MIETTVLCDVKKEAALFKRNTFDAVNFLPFKNSNPIKMTILSLCRNEELP